MRFLTALCILTIFFAVSISPLLADDITDLPVPASDVVSVAAPTVAFAQDSPLAEANASLVEESKTITQPKARNLNKAMLGLTAAGLLMIPFDKKAVDSIDRTPCGERSDAFTETANMFGDRNLLLAGVGSMYLFGKGSTKDTANMALSALMASGSMTQGLKTLAGRGRPSTDIDPGKFLGPGSGGNRASFPSGHTSAAFAVATVFAKRQPKHKWLYYGLATAVGLARVRKSAHYPSDVLVGAGIGMYAGNKAVSGDVSVFPFRLKF